MGWYDLFAPFYDASVERLYREQRAAAAEALDLGGGPLALLDLPTGTGQSLPYLAGEGRTIIGVDFSEGMLRQAKKRVAKEALPGVHLLRGDARSLSAQDLAPAEVSQVDRLHIFLGLSAFPDWEQAFENLWGLLAPGGLCAVVDVYAEKPGFQGKMVEWVAKAELSRRTWEPLERLAEDFQKVPLPSLPDHGGDLFLATGRKPAS